VDRCVVLVDAGYLLGAAASLLAGESSRSRIAVEHAELIRSLRERAEAETGLPLLRIYWFDAAPDRRPMPEHRRLRVTPRVTVRLGALTRADGRWVQKGVDAAMHAELSELARNRACADVVLVTGDGDLLPGMMAAKEHGVAVHLWAVQAADGDFNQSEDLVAEADERRVLDREWLIRSVRVRELVQPCTPPMPRPDIAKILSAPHPGGAGRPPEPLGGPAEAVPPVPAVPAVPAVPQGPAAPVGAEHAGTPAGVEPPPQPGTGQDTTGPGREAAAGPAAVGAGAESGYPGRGDRPAPHPEHPEHPQRPERSERPGHSGPPGHADPADRDHAESARPPAGSAHDDRAEQPEHSGAAGSDVPLKPGAAGPGAAGPGVAGPAAGRPVPTPKEIAAGLAGPKPGAPGLPGAPAAPGGGAAGAAGPAASELRWSSDRGMVDRLPEPPGPAESLPTLGQLTTAEQRWADREEDITTVGGDPHEVGQVFARRWSDRVTDEEHIAVLWREYPRVPHKLDGELLRYAARFGLLAHKDDQIDEHDRYAIRAGFWREVSTRVPGAAEALIDD